MAEAMHPQAHEHDEHSGLHVHSGFAAHHGHADASHSDKCTLCADCCSVSVLATVMETVVEPLEPSAQTFPASAPPVPSFVSGGQERPPRSI